MDSLPSELHLMIFQFLPVSDTIRLRLVSKNWNHLLNCVKHRSLAVFDQDPDGMLSFACDECHYDEFWELEPADSVECKNENLLLTAPLLPMLRSVQKLTTHFYSQTIVKMSKFYNRFRELEELTCFHYFDFLGAYDFSDMTIILNLPRLNKLIVRKADSSRFDLRTPCLTHLEIISLSQCDFYYPDRLKRLESSLNDHHLIDFTKFTGLELLIVNGNDSEFLTNYFLSTLKSLKKLHFTAGNWLSRDTVNLSYRRDGLKLYLFGFDFDKPLEILEEKFPYGTEEEETRVIVRNYEKTAEIVYFWIWIEYNELTRTGFSPNFFTKFPRVDSIKVNGEVEDEDALLEFLLQAKPQGFVMENHLLSPRFLNRFALQCNFIQYIRLKNLPLDTTHSQFEFILKMKSLTVIKILHQKPWTPDLDFLVRLFEHCKRLSEVYFSIEHNYDGCSFSPYWLSFRNDSVYTNLKTKNKTDLLHVLRALQRETKSNQLTSLAELVFLIENHKHYQFLLEDHARKLLRGELYYIY